MPAQARRWNLPDSSDWAGLTARIMLGLTAALFIAVLYFVLRRRVALPLTA